MRRRLPTILILGCFLALVAASYGRALFRGEQFAYRDTAHFYYPLYRRVQAEWEAGRWPLWEPEENGGMPLLGNPTAAVLYPGKVLYALFRDDWGARLYVVAHTALAFAGMLILLRSWGTSVTGSSLGALSYAFGGPILFQYCNIIFLVGAAWLPFGIRAVDRWLRLGRRSALIELAVVLAMQALGGDPETAYLTGLCAGGYAVGLAWRQGHPTAPPVPAWRLALTLGAAVTVWVVATIELALRLPPLRPHLRPGYPALAFTWMSWAPLAIAALWGCAGLCLLARWRRRERSPLGVMLAGLAGSAALAGALAAAQLLPVMEFTLQSARAAEDGTHDIYPFSLEPIRLAEFVWPNVFGTHFAGNRSWLSAIPPKTSHANVWVPSLYLGGLTIVLALGAAGCRGGPPYRSWLTAIALVSLLASLGEYASPLWWARWSPVLAARLGPHDPHNVGTIRIDGQLRDGDGSIYWVLATLVPGFRQFRYPSKLLTFTALAVSALGGLGWDRLASGSSRRPARLATALLALTLSAGAVAEARRPRILQAFAAAADLGSPFGPLDPTGAFADLRCALVQGAAILLVVLVLALRRRRAGWADALAPVLLTADLALANTHFVLTVPQRELDAKPEVVRLIEEAERKDPAPGPYRVHRMPIWTPIAWVRDSSPDRVRQFVAWERDTIQPKYGLLWGVHYTQTLGVAELYDHSWFFGGFLRALEPPMARFLHANPGQQVVVYPRRGFDMWNSRYFVIPAYPHGWRDEERGYVSFLEHTEPIYPDPRKFSGPDGQKRQKEWLECQDFQLLRNTSAYPRAWVVHSARFLPSIVGMNRAERDAPMQEILFQNDSLWNDQDRTVYDPRQLAWIDLDKRPELLGYLPEGPPGSSESVTFVSLGPQRVELEAVLERPGLVILADIYYPGWRLTIDGLEAPIYRANRMMRGAAVKSGRHRLVYTYEPRSFRLGGRISLAGLAVAILLGWDFLTVGARTSGQRGHFGRPELPENPKQVSAREGLPRHLLPRRPLRKLSALVRPRRESPPGILVLPPPGLDQPFTRGNSDDRISN